MWPLFAVCPAGTEDLAATELVALGATDVRPGRKGVLGLGGLKEALSICLWARVPSRLLLEIGHFACDGRQDLYAGSRAIHWPEHLDCDTSIAVDCSRGEGSLSQTQFVALVVKDAIVDSLRDLVGRRPCVDVKNPGLKISVFIARGRAHLYVDLSTQSLHRRGYRQSAGAGEAPLKENLAAAIVMRAGLKTAKDFAHAFYDPMCGSGTLVIEAAMMAADIAPGLMRQMGPSTAWRMLDTTVGPPLWRAAHARRLEGIANLAANRIGGSDRDIAQIARAQRALSALGLGDKVPVRHLSLDSWQADPNDVLGHIVTNPPLGHRLGDAASLTATYGQLGHAIRRHPQWQAHVLVAEPQLGHALGLRATRAHTLHNGEIACRLLHFVLRPKALNKKANQEVPVHPADGKPLAPSVAPGDHEALVNRLSKRYAALHAALKAGETEAFRLYDGDLPQFNAAIDIYRDWAHVQEYQAPKYVAPMRAAQRLQALLVALSDATGIPMERIVVKIRAKQQPRPGGVLRQYGQRGGQDSRRHAVDGPDWRHGGLWVKEGAARFWVHLTAYLDTGLFLDHRLLRRWFFLNSAKLRVLNLFGYTGSVSVMAALGGAQSTTTVDLSANYLEWAEKNFVGNGLQSGDHTLVRADALVWLERQKTESQRWDLIFINPPTFSHSKRMQGVLNVKADKDQLIQSALALMPPSGSVIFSSHARGIAAPCVTDTGYRVNDMTRSVVPPDFVRTASLKAWHISRADLKALRL